MPAAIAPVVYFLLIVGLFWLDRDEKVQTSKALWISVAWFSLACSRPVAQWLQVSAIDSPDQVLEGSPLDRLVFTGLLVVGLIVLFSRGQRIGRFLSGNAPILLLFLYCAMSLLWSDYPEVAFKRWAKSLGDLIMTLSVLCVRGPAPALKQLLSRTTLVPSSPAGLFSKYSPSL